MNSDGGENSGKTEATGGAQPSPRPRDAATLVIVDHTLGLPRILMGQRRPDQVFMPNKFVFPGGRVDPADRQVNPLRDLRQADIERLMFDMKGGNASPLRARALALAAIRETFEETGLLVGADVGDATSISGANDPDGPWGSFHAHGVRPDLGSLSFLARAITPPGRPRRYDTRFFQVDASCVAKTVNEQDEELRNVGWFTIDELRNLDLPNITRAVVEDLADRLSFGPNASSQPAVPYYFYRSGGFERVLIRSDKGSA